jgi:hypothetical protein
MIGVVDKAGIEDLKNLLSVVDQEIFTSKQLCLINPTFGSASELVGGADADLVIDDTIIDIKTTKSLLLDRRSFDQVLGYYILHQIASVGELQPRPNIAKIAIYFSRHAHLHTISISEMINPKTFPAFINWFQRRARQAFPI